MTPEFDENPGKSDKRTPRALLQSIERHLSQTGPVTDEQAYQAQQLVYDAWEAPTEAAQKKLISGALKIDPHNVDALLHAIGRAGLDAEQRILALRKVVNIGEKNLGPKAFKEFAGAFWGFMETRPYMRARHQLAEALRDAGRLEEAVAEYNAILKLNPNDNQGVRYALLVSLLALGQLPEVRKLFKKYPEIKFNAVFAWGRVLEQFLSNDLPGAAAALAVARKQNPHIQPYLTGKQALPREVPPSYSPGSKEEAICFARDLHTAWSKHPPAMTWLKSQSA